MMTRLIMLNGDDDDDDHITATNMIIDPIDCYEPCNVTIAVTWTNTSEERKRFRPAIDVNGIRIELGIEISLKSHRTTTQTFNLTDLMEGVYTVCPYPN